MDPNDFRDKMAHEVELYREEGRQAHRNGKTIADMPYCPFVGQKPLFYVSPGENWIVGWHEEEAKR